MLNSLAPRATLLVLAVVAGPADAFVLPNGSTDADAVRWQNTASGAAGSAGDPVTLTWSIVPDGTSTRDLETNSSFAASDLIASFDATFGAGPGGSDYTQRPWFTLIEQSFERWEELSGIDYVYEPNDDGVQHGEANSGVAGVRGDIRVSGVGVDGDLGVLAYNYFPSDGGDLTFDTDDTADYFGEATDNYRQFRYTATHEMGHGFGLDHTASSDSAFLMEATTNENIDGPQHDDLRGAHWLYGDALEKTNGGAGNDTPATAYGLGALSVGAPLAIGAGGDGVFIDPVETDFVSIDRASDLDVFSFTVTEPTTLDIVLAPRGAQYDQSGTAFDTTTTSDLSLTLLAEDGATPLVSATSQPAGVAETIAAFEIASPGEYFIRVEGVGAVVQLYQLDLVALPRLPGDYNGDGAVDAADYSVYRDTLGQPTSRYAGADGDGDGEVDADDYAVWASNLGGVLDAAIATPEPATLFLLGSTSALYRSRRLRAF